VVRCQVRCWLRVKGVIYHVVIKMLRIGPKR
jgi:hypothetical protein